MVRVHLGPLISMIKSKGFFRQGEENAGDGLFFGWKQIPEERQKSIIQVLFFVLFRYNVVKIIAAVCLSKHFPIIPTGLSNIGKQETALSQG